MAPARRSIAWRDSPESETVDFVTKRPVLSVGEAEEALQQPLDVVELDLEPVGETGDVRRNWYRFGHSHLERGPHPGKRRAKLVRGIGDELALKGERALEAVEQLVERVRQFFQLVVGAVEVEALMQVGGGDFPRSRRHGPQRPQEPSRHEPTKGQ